MGGKPIQIMIVTKDPLSGRLLQASDALFADRIMDLQKTKSPWVVIDELITYWKKTRPTEWQSFIVDITETRDSRNNEFGSSNRNSGRYLADVPKKIVDAIAALYAGTDFVYNDKKFYHELVKRHPEFKVAEKI